MRQTDETPAIPLWIGGRAYLTLAPEFLDVYDARSGRVLRRVPSCGEREAQAAVAAAQAALAPWLALGVPRRAALLADLGAALAGYAAHFARLIDAETGCGGAQSEAELYAAGELLRQPARSDEEAYVGVLAGTPRQPLSALLRDAVAAWQGGATLLVVASPQAPSAVFALAELSARAALPGGVFNVLYGGEATLEALRACLPESAAGVQASAERRR